LGIKRLPSHLKPTTYQTLSCFRHLRGKIEDV
jgi:hypothetical protein